MSQAVPPRNEEPCPSCGLLLDVTGEPLLGLVKCPRCHSEVHVRRQVGRYELLNVLGQGGSGMVFRARLQGYGEDDEKADEFALKVLERSRPDYEEHLLFLKNEKLFARLVDHPRVVKVIGLEEDGEGSRLLMAVMEGGSLHDLMVSGVKLGEARLLETGLEILKALSAAHAKGIIHRDLKPANILFNSSGGAKLGDFGLARSLITEVRDEPHLMVTPDYIAPEILAGEPGDFRSDLYGLGGTLYHALTCQPPYRTDGCSTEELLHLKKTPVKLTCAPYDLHPRTTILINRMMEPDPEARFFSYDELEEVFRLTLDHLEHPHRVSRGRRRKGGGTLGRFFSKLLGKK